MTVRKLPVGTRRASLAPAQTRLVPDPLAEKFRRIEPKMNPVKALEDRVPYEKRGETDGRRAPARRIEDRLAGGGFVAAISSLKDLSVGVRLGMKIGAAPARGTRRTPSTHPTERCPLSSRKGRVGTSIIRMKAQLLNLRSYSGVDLNGAVETKVRELSEPHLGAAVSVAAGPKEGR